MKRVTRGKIVPVRISDEELRKIDGLLGKAGSRSRSEFVRDAVRYYLDNVAGMRAIQLRDLGKEQAKKEIMEYLLKRKEAETFDIANDLRLDLNLTVRSLKELWGEGRIK